MMNFFNNLCAGASRICYAAVTSPPAWYDTLMHSIGSTLANLGLSIYEFFVQLVWLIMQFVLVMIDFFFVFARKLAGSSASFSGLDNLRNSDMIFQYLLSEPVLNIVEGLFIIGVVLVIVFSIISIIKNEYMAATTGANNSKGQILASALRSFLMMILVPAIMFGSIFLSNALVTALYNVTAGDTDISMGTEIFIASTYQANRYRSYATNGLRIPVTYDFSEVQVDENIDGWAESGTIAEMEEAYKAFRNKSVWDRGFTTYIMFLNNTFDLMSEIEEADKAAFAGGEPGGGAYHLTYDDGLFFKQAEYFQMAEVVDYAMRTGEEIYFKTPQDIMLSWSSVTSTYVDKYRPYFSGSYTSNIGFSIQYSNEDERTHYTSIHSAVTGVKDESKGSQFLVCTRKTDGEHDFFAPLLAGVDFYSSYTEGNNLVVARGLFEDAAYPTAIREVNGETQCYRDKINAPYLMDLFPKVSYELPEGTTQNLHNKLIKEGIEFVTGINVDAYIPYIYYNFDIFRLFTKINRTVATIDGGIEINYTFNDKDLNFTNVYDYAAVNLLILVFCSVILISMLFKAIFGIAARVFDIVLLFITYPIVCATIPIDGGARFKSWTDVFVKKLMSIYSFVLSINFVLMLYPIIQEVKVFSPAQVDELFVKGIALPGWTAEFVNVLIQFLMTFVSFNFFEVAIRLIAQILGYDVKDIQNWDMDKKRKDKKSGKELKGDKASDPEVSIVDRGASVLNEAKSAGSAIVSVVSGQYFIDTIKKPFETAAGLIPGIAIVKKIDENNKFNAKQAAITQEQKVLVDQIQGAKQKQDDARSQAAAAGKSTADQDAAADAAKAQSTSDISAQTAKIDKMIK